MIHFSGKGVYGAVAVGKISVFKNREISVKPEKIQDTEAEKKRLSDARKEAIAQLETVYEKALREVGEAGAQIFEMHRLLIEDVDYNESIRELIEVQHMNAEYAVAKTADKLAERFAAMEDSYMQARGDDIRDVSQRILRCLSKSSPDKNKSDEEMILCADDLSPSETVSLEKERILAFVTARGSMNSHTAILARDMNIPAIVGLGDAFLKEVRDGDLALVDGFTGELILHPDEETVERARKKQAEAVEQNELLQKLRGKENVTQDGTQIDIFANIGSVDSIEEVLHSDAGGIGLFRSEFIYLERKDFPTEEEQFQIYKSVLEGMGDKKVIIRTLDIGADKQADYFQLEEEENPALGLRGIRLCLTRPAVFKTQLRALYRASAFGHLGIMFPMITGTKELVDILALCTEVKNELKRDKIAYSDRVELGIMIETPAAALISDKLAPMVDFFSVGTNDLIQYTLACDRGNPNIEGFCDIHHEGVLRLIELTAQNAHANNIRIGICGELAADISLTERFLRMGIDELSVSPAYVLKVRNKVRNTKIKE